MNFEIDFFRLKIQFVELVFSKLIFQKPSTDQQVLRPYHLNLQATDRLFMLSYSRRSRSTKGRWSGITRAKIRWNWQPFHGLQAILRKIQKIQKIQPSGIFIKYFNSIILILVYIFRWENIQFWLIVNANHDFWQL